MRATLCNFVLRTVLTVHVKAACPCVPCIGHIACLANLLARTFSMLAFGHAYYYMHVCATVLGPLATWLLAGVAPWDHAIIEWLKAGIAHRLAVWQGRRSCLLLCTCVLLSWAPLATWLLVGAAPWGPCHCCMAEGGQSPPSCCVARLSVMLAIMHVCAAVPGLLQLGCLLGSPLVLGPCHYYMAECGRCPPYCRVPLASWLARTLSMLAFGHACFMHVGACCSGP
jgi:hypothetical protein